MIVSLLMHILREEDAAVGLEYGLVVALVALAIAGVALSFGETLSGIFQSAGEGVDGGQTLVIPPLEVQ